MSRKEWATTALSPPKSATVCVQLYHSRSASKRLLLIRGSTVSSNISTKAPPTEMWVSMKIRDIITATNYKTQASELGG